MFHSQRDNMGQNSHKGDIKGCFDCADVFMKDMLNAECVRCYHYPSKSLLVLPAKTLNGCQVSDTSERERKGFQSSSCSSSVFFFLHSEMNGGVLPLQS